MRSGCLSVSSVALATQDRSPGVNSAAFRAQSAGLRFAPLMDMDFAVRCPLVRRSRLIPGSCPSTRTFALRFFRTPPRDGSPCVLLTLHLHQVGWKDLHLQAAEHAQHTTKPASRVVAGRRCYDLSGQVACRTTPQTWAQSKQFRLTQWPDPSPNCCSAMKTHKAIVLPNPGFTTNRRIHTAPH